MRQRTHSYQGIKHGCCLFFSPFKIEIEIFQGGKLLKAVQKFFDSCFSNFETSGNEVKKDVFCGIYLFTKG